MINKYILILVSLFILTVEVKAQSSNLKCGQLDNGLSYYILGSSDFSNEVNFYLYQNIGSIVEDDNQNGFAHFIEHMAFNETRHFPTGVMNFFKNSGINKFNARTGINETLYSIYSISNNSPLKDSVLLVFKDWCNGVLFKKKDFEKEKRIIIEEWRMRNDVNKRIGDSIAYPIYNFSKYSKRNIIGNEQLLKRYKVNDLELFYKQWYNPQLQCVVIIGDIDPKEYEKKIKDLFGNISKSKLSKNRENIIIEDNKFPLYYRFEDKENINNSFGIYQRIKQDTSYSSNKNHLLEMIFNKLASQKLAMIRNNGDEEFIAATVDYSPLVRMYAQNAWDVVPYKGKELEALKQVLSIREGFRKVGFSNNDFERIKKQIYDDLKSLINSDNLGTPDNYMEIFKQNYLYNKPILSFNEQLVALVEELVELENDDLNIWIRSWMDDSNMSFITYSSSAEDMKISLNYFIDLLNEVKKDSLNYTNLLDKRPPIADIIDFDVMPGRVVNKKKISELDVEEWTLSNGARLLYKFTPGKYNDFYFVASAMGGNSLVNSKDIPSYNAMKALIMQSGVHKYNRNQLYDWVQHKKIDLNISITDYTDGIGGSSSINDAEDYFKYFYLVLTHQNFDKNVFTKYLEREKYLYQTQVKSDMAVCQDSIKEILYPYTDLNPKKDMEYFNKMKYEDLDRLFKDHYGNASDFTFCLVGALPEDKAEVLVQKYIASLPAIPSVEKRKYKVFDFSSKEQIIKKEFYINSQDNIGEVEISYINDILLSGKEKKAMQILESILQNILFFELREKAEGTYNVGTRIDYTETPKGNVVFNVHFSTQSNRVDELKEITYQIIENVLNGDISDKLYGNSYAEKVIEEKQENTLMDSGNEILPLEWLSILNTYSDFGILPSDMQEDEVSMETVSKQDVIDVFNKIIKNSKKRDIVIKSKAKNPNDILLEDY